MQTLNVYIDTVIMLKTLCQVYTPLRINALTCLPTLTWFCMVNVGHILPYIDPMGTLIPRPTGLIGVTKEGKLQLLLRRLPSVQIGENLPHVFPWCFHGIFLRGNFQVCLLTQVFIKRKNRIGKWRFGFLENLMKTSDDQCFCFPASQKEVWFFLRESVLQTSTTMSNQYRMIFGFAGREMWPLCRGKWPKIYLSWLVNLYTPNVPPEIACLMWSRLINHWFLLRLYEKNICFWGGSVGVG